MKSIAGCYEGFLDTSALELQMSPSQSGRWQI